MGGQDGSDDGATKATDDGADCGTGPFAAEKSMRLPRTRGDACSCASADAGSNETVAQTVAALGEFDAADILLLQGLIALGLREHDCSAGDTDESTGMLLRGCVDDLNSLAGMKGVQIIPGGRMGLSG